MIIIFFYFITNLVLAEERYHYNSIPSYVNNFLWMSIQETSWKKQYQETLNKKLQGKLNNILSVKTILETAKKMRGQ